MLRIAIVAATQEPEVRIEHTPRRLILPVSVADQLHLVYRRLEEAAIGSTPLRSGFRIACVDSLFVVGFAKFLDNLLSLPALLWEEK